MGLKDLSVSFQSAYSEVLVLRPWWNSAIQFHGLILRQENNIGVVWLVFNMINISAHVF